MEFGSGGDEERHDCGIGGHSERSARSRGRMVACRWAGGSAAYVVAPVGVDTGAVMRRVHEGVLGVFLSTSQGSPPSK